MKVLMIEPVITPRRLLTRVEALVNHDGMRYSEAIVQICNELDIDPTEIIHMIPSSLKEKLFADGVRHNCIPKLKHNTAKLFAD